MKNMPDTYCLVCKKKTGNIDPQAKKNKKGRLMVMSKCPVCGKRKSRFIKKQEGDGLLSSLGIKTPLSNIPGLNILF